MSCKQRQRIKTDSKDYTIEGYLASVSSGKEGRRVGAGVRMMSFEHFSLKTHRLSSWSCHNKIKFTFCGACVWVLVLQLKQSAGGKLRKPV